MRDTFGVLASAGQRSLPARFSGAGKAAVACVNKLKPFPSRSVLFLHCQRTRHPENDVKIDQPGSKVEPVSPTLARRSPERKQGASVTVQLDGSESCFLPRLGSGSKEFTRSY